MPIALATAGDSLILVADGSRRVWEFGFDGAVRGKTAPAPFYVLAAARLCDSVWVAYGPEGLASSTNWIHRFKILHSEKAVEQVSAFSDSMAGDGFGMGKPYGLVATPTGALIRHQAGKQEGILTLSCDGRATFTALPPELRIGEEGNTGGTAIREGTMIPVGLASVRDTIVLATTIMGDDRKESTQLTYFDKMGAHSTMVPGVYILRDSKPGVGVLVEVEGSAPRVFLIRESDFLKVFRR